MLENAAWFAAGWLSAMVGTFAFGIWALKRDKERKQQQKLENLKAQKIALEKEKTADERLRRASEITLQQSQLNLNSGSTETLIQFNNLEVEKISILKSIVKDGYDPIITIKLGSENRQMSLSNYIASLQKVLH